MTSKKNEKARGSGPRERLHNAGRRMPAALLAGAAICGSMFTQDLGAAAAKLKTVYSFNGTDGSHPIGSLVSDSGGSLYGVAWFGGTSNNGTLYQLTPPPAGGAWTLTVLHTFAGGSDGSVPTGDLVFGKNGALYGTTTDGGTSNAGTVFELLPPTVAGGAWTETVLYNFANGADGGIPAGGVIFGQGGALYGTANNGGASNNGVVFELAPPAGGGAWTYTAIHQFAGGLDGAHPLAKLALGIGGVLYGTTSVGGVSGLGTVFAMQPPAAAGDAWTESILHSFAGGSDGATPYAGVALGAGGTLYGTTSSGGSGSSSGAAGTVFQLTPPTVAGSVWNETVLYAFTGGSDGNSPYAGVLVGKGALYGTTSYNGPLGQGTVFELQAPPAAGGVWTVSVLGSLGGVLGRNPAGGVVFGKNGALYGTTSGGKSSNGTVFQVGP